MKYTLTIKDNETGEIMHNLECNAIIGAANDGNEIHCFADTECNLINLLQTCAGAITAIESCTSNAPEVIKQASKCNLFELPAALDLITANLAKNEGSENNE